MTTIKEEFPGSLTEYLTIVEKLQQKGGDDPLWYRGCKDSTHGLIPTIYRHKDLKSGEQVLTLEKKIINRFRQRSIPYIGREITDDLSLLFFMQHYGVPTRLLDWTENPLVALYFAVMNNILTSSNTVKSDSAVWVLNPTNWNRTVLAYLQFNGDILSPSDAPLKAFYPQSSYDSVNEDPVALFGEYNSTRIIAQQGVFTVFGKGNLPMNKTYQKKTFIEDTLTKIIIKKPRVIEIRKALLRQGTIETVVFPDLYGLAQEIRRFFDFS